MGFGLSFGAKKQKVNTTTNVDKTDTTTQEQTGTKAQTGTTTSQGTQSQTGTSTGQQATSQQGSAQTSGTAASTTQQTTSAFNSPVLQGIEAAVQSLFAKTASPAAASNFNADQFVADGVQAAQSDLGAGLEGNLNQLISNIGGRAGSNSMTALLSNRLRGDAAAEVAGVRSNLTQQAQSIQRDNTLAASQVAATDQGFLANLLGALKGGQVTTTGTESQVTSQNQQTQQTGTATSAEQTAQQATSAETQTQNLIEALSQLLSGTTNTVGTENTKGTTSEKGGGFSLAL